MNELRVRVSLRPLPLSRACASALRSCARYDLVVFTSKNARKFFNAALNKFRVPPPPPSRIVQVGPRNDLLKLSVRGKRILFPRSAVAPFDIVRRLRARGAVVRVVPLYTVAGVPLTHAEMRALERGTVKKLHFRSPSGISGLLRKLDQPTRRETLRLPVSCIGATTAKAARTAGFKKVSITGIM